MSFANSNRLTVVSKRGVMFFPITLVPIFSEKVSKFYRAVFEIFPFGPYLTVELGRNSF
jgi:hypothetical protein